MVFAHHSELLRELNREVLQYLSLFEVAEVFAGHAAVDLLGQKSYHYCPR